MTYNVTHLILIIPSDIHAFFLSSSDIIIGPWVIVAGCWTNVSTPPRDTANWASFRFCKYIEKFNRTNSALSGKTRFLFSR